jgi:hypothetical protein
MPVKSGNQQASGECDEAHFRFSADAGLIYAVASLKGSCNVMASCADKMI